MAQAGKEPRFQAISSHFGSELYLAMELGDLQPFATTLVLRTSRKLHFRQVLSVRLGFRREVCFENRVKTRWNSDVCQLNRRFWASKLEVGSNLLRC